MVCHTRLSETAGTRRRWSSGEHFKNIQVKGHGAHGWFPIRSLIDGGGQLKVYVNDERSEREPWVYNRCP